MTLVAYTADGRAKSKGQTFAPNGVVCRAQCTADAGVPGGTVVLGNHLNTKVFDPFNFFSLTTNRFQPNIPGYYRCSFGPQIRGLSSGAEVDTFIRKNGNSIGEASSVNPAVSAGWSGGAITAIIYLNGTTDYVDLAVYTPAAATLIGVSNNRTWFDAELIASSIGVAPEPWHVVGAAGEPAFQNGWTHYTPASGYNPVRFMKDPHGFVHLSGMAMGGTMAQPIYMLPVGYRPSYQWLFATLSGGNTTAARLDVLTNGNVLPQGGVNAFYTMDGLTFRAEQ